MMLDPQGLPNIVTAFDDPPGDPTARLHKEIIQTVLVKMLPSGFFSRLTLLETQEERLVALNLELPLMGYSSAAAVPFNMSFYVLSKFRPNAFKFIFEMLSSWLVPGKRLNVVLLNAVDFNMPDFGVDTYTLCEVMVRVDSVIEYEQIRRGLPVIETEVRLGVASAYYARRILETKGLAADEKTAQIQEFMADLVKRWPQHFDYDLFTEMQQVLVMCRDDFKAIREVRHLSRIISMKYIFRKLIRKFASEAPQKRHLLLKLSNTTVHHSTGDRAALSMVVGVNFLHDKEVFEERHLIKAIQNQIPMVKVTDRSFFSIREGSENVCTLYIEVEKPDGNPFSHQEIQKLRKALPSDLKDRIEHPMHPLFNPRNEEEIMRNILALANQIKYVRDIPQVFITFDEQSYGHLFFTVIVVRVLKEGSKTIEEMFKSNPSPLEYIPDRCKGLGFIRKKYPKEATVFRVKVPKEEFLRHDHSIDLYKARQSIVSELAQVIGEVRDYNGGMITKQNELLCVLRDKLKSDGPVNNFLLENFFYSLTPVIMRSVMEPAALKTLYKMLLDSIHSGVTAGEPNVARFHEDAEFLYSVVIGEDITLGERLGSVIQLMGIASTSLATAQVNVNDLRCCGYIYRCDNPTRREAFCSGIRTAVQNAATARR